MSNDTLAASCAQAAKDAVRFQDERDQLAAENARLRVEVERLTAAPPPAAARVDVTWPLSILEAGNWREVYMGTKHMRLAVSYPYEAWERLMAALAAAQQQQQQPAEGEDIMVNTPYDVFILPLRPSGLDGKGPRFVVHVPGPEARGGGKAAPPSAPVGATLSNPWTGKPRDYRDVDSDPEGVLCVEPGAPLKAAPSAPSGVWMRALRLADDAAESVICDAAESVICTAGHSPAAYHWVLWHEQIAADPYLEDAIAHLEWRGIAKAVREDGRVTVIFEEQP